MHQFPQTSSCSRRQFLSGCAACAGCVVGGTLLGPRLVTAAGTAHGKPKIRLVFCETTNDKPICPNIGYDFALRRNRVIVHQAKAVGNNPSDLACRTKLEAVVKGDIEKLTENGQMGWHRVTFYGDLQEPISELCERLKLELVQEA